MLWRNLMKDKISIIVPIYNAEKYLRECLDSLINQTYTNLEIILVNDGSKDSSYAIAKEYALKDNRIKLYTKENGGLSDARNFGLERATGKYIGFTDNDDKAFPNQFERLYQMITENDSDMAICSFVKSDEELKNEEIIVNTYNIQEIFDDIILDKIHAYVWKKLYKKEYFDEFKFPMGLHFEDLAIFYKMAFNMKKITISNEQLYWYRVDRNDSITSNRKNSLYNGVCIAKIYREKTDFSYNENLKVKNQVLQMSIKYNTDTYRNIKKYKKYYEELEVIKTYLVKYYKDIMFDGDIDIIRKTFTFLIKHGLY